MSRRIGELNYGNIDDGELLIKQGRNLVGLNPATLGGSSSVFVYAEGGTAGGNIYTSFADAHAAASLITSGERVIYFDDTASPGNSFIPAGAWDLDNGRISLETAASFGGGTIVDVQDGATLVDPGLIRGNLELRSTSNSPIITAGAGSQPPLIISDGATVEANGTAPFIFLGPGAFYVIALEFGGRLKQGSTATVDVNDFSAVLQLVVFDSAQVDDCVVGNGIAFAIAFGSGVTIVDPQTGLTFPLTITPNERADLTAFTPAVPGNWAPPPAQVAEALDQLAAAGGGGDNLGNHTATTTLDMNTQAISVDDEQKYEYVQDAANTFFQLENGGQVSAINNAGSVVMCIDTDNDTANAFFGVAADDNINGTPTQVMQMYENGQLAVRSTGRVGTLSDINSTSAAWEVDHTPGVTSGIRTAVMSTVDRDAAGGGGGLIIYNSDRDEFQGHDNSSWVPLENGYGKQIGIVDGASVSWDAAVDGRNVVLTTVQASLTMQNPTNLIQGMPLILVIQCTAGGGTTVNWDSQYFDQNGNPMAPLVMSNGQTFVRKFVSTNGAAMINF